jgi:cytochrome c oxidase subunit 2
MAVSTGVVDNIFIYIVTIAFLLFGFIVFLMIYYVVRYRRSRNPRPADISGNAALEITWIGVSTLLVLTMFFYGLTGFRFLRNPPQNALEIGVVARQWSWEFDYPNGKTSTRLIVPAGEPVRLRLTSKDVIHSFFVPAFRVKQDAVPGLTTQAWFNAGVPGTYDILCAEYCGLLHSHMLTQLVVVPKDQYDQWYAQP